MNSNKHRKVRGQSNQDIPRAHKFALLEAQGVPASRASKIAGYKTSPHFIRQTSAYKQFKAEIREKRVEIAKQEGFTINASAEWYRGIANDDKMSGNVRIRARELLDKLLGYFAPLEVEQEKPEQERPIIALINILQEHNINPLELMRETSFQPVKQSNINAIEPATTAGAHKQGVLPVKEMSSNNYYVNLQERNQDADLERSEAEPADPGSAPYPKKNSGRGGCRVRGEARQNGIPSPYHRVTLI